MQCYVCLKWISEDEVRSAYRVFNAGCSLCLECAQQMDQEEKESNRRIDENNRRVRGGER